MKVSLQTYLFIILCCMLASPLSASSLCGLQECFGWSNPQEEGLVSYIVNEKREKLEAKLNRSDVNERDFQGRTPLLEAIKRNQADTVAQLLDHGADPNQEDRVENNPLHVAIKGKCNRIIMLLVLNKRTDLEKIACDGHTPLSTAACFGDAHTVKELLSKGVNPNRCLHQEHSYALRAAIARKHTAVATLLLQHGATPKPGLFEQIVHHYLPENRLVRPSNQFLQLLEVLVKSDGLPQLSARRKTLLQYKIGGSALGLGQAFWEKLERIADGCQSA